MKLLKLFTLTLLLLLDVFSSARANLIQFDISPPNLDFGVGLSAANEVLAGLDAGVGGGTGGLIDLGVSLDTDSLTLAFAIGYGSARGFHDLSGPAFAWLLHGPASSGETAPVLFDLQPFHTRAPDPTAGGTILGTLLLTSTQASDLLLGLDYVNIYTDAHPGGEIRGRLFPRVGVPVPDGGPDLFCTAILLAGLGSVSIARRKEPSDVVPSRS
ncbi:MAG: CHRD domain-containing protein [Verrucomicrobiota bacterium]